MSLWLNFAHKAGTCSLAAMSRNDPGSGKDQ